MKQFLFILFILQVQLCYAENIPAGKWHDVGAKETVLLIGGAEGGKAWQFFPEQITELKESGFNVYQSEYFRYPDTFLQDIDLHYFSDIVDWLMKVKKQSAIKIIAHSRGTEAATWLAAEFSSIAGLVLISPASHFFQGVQPSLEATFERPTSAWKAGDAGIPFVAYKLTEDLKQQTIKYAMKGELCPCSKAVYQTSLDYADPDSQLPVGTIQAKVLLLAGKDDLIWPALSMAKNLQKRMQKANVQARLAVHSGGHNLHQDPSIWQSIVKFTGNNR